MLRSRLLSYFPHVRWWCWNKQLWFCLSYGCWPVSSLIAQASSSLATRGRLYSLAQEFLSLSCLHIQPHHNRLCTSAEAKHKSISLLYWVQVEKAQLSQPVLIGEVLQPFAFLLWNCAKAPHPACAGGPRPGHNTTSDGALHGQSREGQPQSQRMTWVGRDLEDHQVPTALLQAGLPTTRSSTTPFFLLLGTPPLVQPRIQLTFRAASIHCWLMCSLLSTRTPKSFSAGLLSMNSSPSLYTYLGLPQQKCNTLHMLDLSRFPWTDFSSLSRSLWMASFPIILLNAPLSLVLSVNLLRVHLILLSMSLAKMLKSTGP